MRKPLPREGGRAPEPPARHPRSFPRASPRPPSTHRPQPPARLSARSPLLPWEQEPRALITDMYVCMSLYVCTHINIIFSLTNALSIYSNLTRTLDPQPPADLSHCRAACTDARRRGQWAPAPTRFLPTTPHDLPRPSPQFSRRRGPARSAANSPCCAAAGRGRLEEKFWGVPAGRERSP